MSAAFAASQRSTPAARGTWEPPSGHHLRVSSRAARLVGLSLGAVTVLAIAGAVRLLAERDDRLEAARMRAAEADPAFVLQPPGTRSLTASGRRTVCVDPSGDPPVTWREYTSSEPDDAVLDFYESSVVALGWEKVGRWPGGGTALASTVTFSKEIAGGPAQLSVGAFVDDDGVTVVMTIPCT